MAKTRALMTETERDRIANREDVEDIKRYQAISRVRRRIDEELIEDVAILRDHHEGLLEELQEVVCEDAETVDIAETDSSESPEEQPEPRNEPAPEPEADRDDGFEALSFPAGVEADDAWETIHAARSYIREHGGATMREIVLEVMPEHPLKYDAPESLETGERYRGAWWRRVVKPGLEALDDVQKPGRGESQWRYIGGSDE